MNGDAPCAECGRHIYNIPVLDDTKESDGHGGFWYEIVGNTKCLECGEPLKFFHVPNPDTLVFDMSVLEEIFLWKEGDR